MKNVLAIAALLGICTLAGADCRARVVVRHNAVAVATPVVAVATVLATPVAVYTPVSVPVYTASYSGQTASGDASIARQFDQLSQRLDAIAGRLESLATNVQPPAQKSQGNAHPGAAFLGQSCVKCHDSSTAKAKGGDLVFFDLGQLVATPQQQWAMTRAVRKGAMPKGGPKADDNAYDAMIDFFEQANAAKIAAKEMPPVK